MKHNWNWNRNKNEQTLDQAKMDKMQHCAQGRIAQALV